MNEEPPSHAGGPPPRKRVSAQEDEIAHLRSEAAEASDERDRFEREAELAHQREAALGALVGRLQTEARAREHDLESLRERLLEVELELDDLRAVRDALTPPELPSRPCLELAASFLPASEHVSGDFYLVAEGPNDASLLIVGDVVGKGHSAARQAAFIRTVFATTAPFSDDPARLLDWANVVLTERDAEDGGFVTVACVALTPQERMLRWGYAGHPPALWLDTGEQLAGGRTQPLGISRDLDATTATHELAPGTGVLLYTDGVTEARRHDEQYGEARLTSTLHTLKGQSPSQIVADLTADVEQFAGNEIDDDLCIVAARVT